MRSSSALLAVVAFACGDVEGKPAITEARSPLARADAPSTANVVALGVNNRDFAFDLFAELRKPAPNANLVVSPYSVSTALAMYYAGTTNEEEAKVARALRFTLGQAPTHEAFNAVDRALSSRGEGLEGADGTPFRLNVDNAIWQQRGQPLESPWLDILAVNYGAGVYQVDFAKQPEAARGAINGWVDERTEQRIPELLPMGSITPSTSLVLTNTVFFNAGWDKPFRAEETTNQRFMRADGDTVEATTMRGFGAREYAEGPGFCAVAVPYVGGQLSMILIVPDAGKLAEIEEQLDRAFFDALVWDTKLVDLSLPKFAFRAKFDLKEALSKLAGSDWTRPDVLHEAVIDVTEQGTVAAAATAVIISKGSIEAELKPVHIDRPFLYAIYDGDTGTVLFLGRVSDPTAP